MHIRKYSESYYNIEWSASLAIPQNWPETQPATYTPEFTTQISEDTYNGTINTSPGEIEGGGN